jgi:hypothetical protein
MAAKCSTKIKPNVQHLSNLNLEDGRGDVCPSSVSAAFQEVH